MTVRFLSAGQEDEATPVRLVEGSDRTYLRDLTEAQRAYVSAIGFEPGPGRLALVPDVAGGIDCVLFGLGSADEIDRTPFLPGKLADQLPQGTYRLTGEPDDPALAALAIGLGAYRFSAYGKAGSGRDIRLVLPEGVEQTELDRIVSGVCLTRDLINTPSNDMGPEELATTARALAAAHNATVETVVGEDLLRAGLPMIHAVGRASVRQPRLIDLRWGAPKGRSVTLVGKGVCFDTGGLDIKPSSGMALMKKDMGGAAAVLGLASMIMSAELPVRLRVLIPAVENAIAGDAFRPGDVLTSRAGRTVSIGNTDAEGRLVLADALTLACEEDSDLIIDMATLTGAARAALGPEVVPFYTFDDALAEDTAEAARKVFDPVWRMPLWRPYERMLESRVADIDNAGSGGMAGSITAALFLSGFVTGHARWIHFDIYGWNPSARPGCPEGGEAQAIRALYELVRNDQRSGR